MLAEMGAAFGLVADRPIDQNQRDLKELHVTRLALVKHRTRLLNRLKTLTLALAKRQTNTRLNLITAQLAALDAEILGAGRLARNRRRRAKSCAPYPESEPSVPPPS